jgi:hypothetical protein
MATETTPPMKKNTSTLDTLPCVTVERAFGALKNKFRILDNKPFHPYKT